MEEVAYERRLKSTPGGRRGLCQGPGAGPSPAWWRSRKEARAAGAEGGAEAGGVAGQVVASRRTCTFPSRGVGALEGWLCVGTAGTRPDLGFTVIFLRFVAPWQLCRVGGAHPALLPPLRGAGQRSEVEGPPPFVPQLFGTHSDSSKEMIWGSSGTVPKPSLLPAQHPELPAGEGATARGGRGGHCPARLHPTRDGPRCTRILSRALPGSVATSTGCRLQEAALGRPEPPRPGSPSCRCSVLVHLSALSQGSLFQRVARPLPAQDRLCFPLPGQG